MQGKRNLLQNSATKLITVDRNAILQIIIEHNKTKRKRTVTKSVFMCSDFEEHPGYWFMDTGELR